MKSVFLNTQKHDTTLTYFQTSLIDIFIDYILKFVITALLIRTGIAENSGVGTFIALISATDADLAGTPEANIAYAIEDTGSIFGIESDTGQYFLLCYILILNITRID